MDSTTGNKILRSDLIKREVIRLSPLVAISVANEFPQFRFGVVVAFCSQL